MSENESANDPATSIGQGLQIKYESCGDECSIIGHFLDDGGVGFTFCRGDRRYPLRLKKEGMDCLLNLYSEMIYRRADLVPTEGKTESPK